jgi:hypothetical protein
MNRYLPVQPPRPQPQIFGHLPGLVHDDPVGHETCINVPGHAGGVIGQGLTVTGDVASWQPGVGEG